MLGKSKKTLTSKIRRTQQQVFAHSRAGRIVSKTSPTRKWLHNKRVPTALYQQLWIHTIDVIVPGRNTDVGLRDIFLKHAPSYLVGQGALSQLFDNDVYSTMFAVSTCAKCQRKAFRFNVQLCSLQSSTFAHNAFQIMPAGDSVGKDRPSSGHVLMLCVNRSTYSRLGLPGRPIGSGKSKNGALGGGGLGKAYEQQRWLISIPLPQHSLDKEKSSNSWERVQWALGHVGRVAFAMCINGRCQNCGNQNNSVPRGWCNHLSLRRVPCEISVRSLSQLPVPDLASVLKVTDATRWPGAVTHTPPSTPASWVMEVKSQSQPEHSDKSRELEVCKQSLLTNCLTWMGAITRHHTSLLRSLRHHTIEGALAGATEFCETKPDDSKRGTCGHCAGSKRMLSPQFDWGPCHLPLLAHQNDQDSGQAGSRSSKGTRGGDVVVVSFKGLFAKDSEFVADMWNAVASHTDAPWVSVYTRSLNAAMLPRSRTLRLPDFTFCGSEVTDPAHDSWVSCVTQPEVVWSCELVTPTSTY